MRTPTVTIRGGIAVALMLLSLSVVNAQLAVGSTAPELSAEHWLNTTGVSLEDNGGRYTVVEFWATWCGPCRDAIPHLVDLYNEYGSTVNFVSLTNEDVEQAGIRSFVEEMGMTYPVGTNSNTVSEYEVRGIPQAFIVDPDGVIVWEGHPMGGMDAAIAQAAAGTLRVVVPGSLESVVLRAKEERTGSLFAGSQPFRGGLVDSYMISGQRGESVLIMLTSPDFDTVVTGYVGDEQVAVNDDYAYDTAVVDALSGRSLPSDYDSAFVYTFAADGDLQVVVGSYGGRETGSYSLVYEILR